MTDPTPLPVPKPIRTGVETSEFKLTIFLGALAVLALIMPEVQPQLKDAAEQVLMLLVPGYAVSRGLAKKG